MRFTFGIITAGEGGSEDRISRIIDSVEMQVPEYEVIVVGAFAPERKDTRVIPFNEKAKPRWITRKKNIITDEARHENVVYMHDYVVLEPGWHDGWEAFGEDFKACMNPILNSNGTRYRDWILCPDNSLDRARRHANCSQLHNILPYNERSLSKFMYFSGAYWVAKKSVMQRFRLNESLSWGEQEDVVWSHQYRSRYDFSLNTSSAVRIHGKKKTKDWKDLTPPMVRAIREFVGANPVPQGWGCYAPYWPLPQQDESPPSPKIAGEAVNDQRHPS